jgi:hypothetical protein
MKKYNKWQYLLGLWLITTLPIWLTIALVKYTVWFGWNLPLLWESWFEEVGK